MKRLAHPLVLILVLMTASTANVTGALAASCWDHNGSLMRLEAQGNRRWFYYESPRPVLRKAGVRRGTLLFDGVKDGNWYSGTARVYSKFCPGAPLEYFVEGPVHRDQLRVTVRGTRQIYSQCQPTGRTKSDILNFIYARKC